MSKEPKIETIWTEDRNHGTSGIKGAVDVKIRCRRALREAWHNSLKHGDIDCDSNHFLGYLREVCSAVSAHLRKGQFDSLVIAAEHNNSYVYYSALDSYFMSIRRFSSSLDQNYFQVFPASSALVLVAWVGSCSLILTETRTTLLSNTNLTLFDTPLKFTLHAYVYRAIN